MDAIESQGGLSEDKESQETASDVRMVPVTESARYHKRAQSAERLAEELAGELADAKAEASRLADELKTTKIEQELVKRLTAEGARDLEAAMLIAGDRLSRDSNADIGGVVEQLKKEKGYLFSERTSAATLRTSPAKESRQAGATVIEKAARRATVTGSRTDLQEYMKKRRVLNFQR